MKIAILTAMEKEATPLCQKLGQMVGDETIHGVHVRIFVNKSIYIYLVKTGVGEIFAAGATQLVIDRYKIDYIVNFGYVGSLSPSLRAGDVVLIDKVAHHNFDLRGLENVKRGQYDNRKNVFFDLFESGNAWINRRLETKLPIVTLASGDEFIASKEKKDGLINDFDASVCDMELAGIAITSERNEIPTVSFKIVSDNADEGAPKDFWNSVKKGFEVVEIIFHNLIEELSEENNII